MITTKVMLPLKSSTYRQKNTKETQRVLKIPKSFVFKSKNPQKMRSVEIVSRADEIIMAYYFYRVSLKKLFGSEYNIKRLYNVEIDGLHYDEPEVYYKHGLEDYTVVAKNKAEALDVVTKYIYEEELEWKEEMEKDFKNGQYPECSLEPTWEEEMEEYFENAHPDDLPYGGYPSKLNI